MTDTIPSCPICRSAMEQVAERAVLRRHRGRYDFCLTCGFLRVREPHWLDEAYATAICAADTGVVARNLQTADWLSPLCRKLDGGRGPYLDFGGGHGLLTRLMRDRGYDFRWSDLHAENNLARGFEWDAQTGQAAAVTAFEVLEHTVDPLAFVEEALAAGQCRTLIFTTELFSGQPPEDWWYYAPEEGQHIAFFRADTLGHLANRLGLRFVTDGHRHLITDRPITSRQLRSATSRLSSIARRWHDRGRGLTQQDHHRMLRRTDDNA